MRQFWQKCAGLAALLALCFCAFFPLVASAEESAFTIPILSNQTYSHIPAEGGDMQLAVNAFTEDAPPLVEAEAYIVMDAATGQVLISKNADRMQYPASITKILTMGLVLENIDITTQGIEPVTVSDAAIDALIPRASMIALGRGEIATVQDLLYATKIESANDAAHALAEYVAGSMDAFAQLMNEKATQLGLTQSHFTNSSGQPEDTHYTSAYDMAEITRWAMGVPGFSQLFAATAYTMPPTNMQPAGRTFNNANLAQVPHSPYYCEGVTGSKTGFTDQAQHTLVTTAKRGDTELICVVMKCASSATKYTSTNALMDYCFNNFRRVSYTLGQAANASVPVFGGGGSSLGDIELYTDEEATFLLHNSLQTDIIDVQLNTPERYIIGNVFQPVANIALPDNLPQQHGGQILSIPLKWRGLEEIMAANTTEGWQFMATEQPILLGTIIGVPAIILALAIGRLCFVRVRRSRLRKKRLQAAKAQLPVRIAERPTPPSVRLMQMQRNTVDYRRPATAAPAWRKTGYQSPHRAGRQR